MLIAVYNFNSSDTEQKYLLYVFAAFFFFEIISSSSTIL